ncbi:hypothetical protein CYMTET_23073 [Cymbomonas tetramitiformis]|uniref:Uncharacterized protein n=1 Tax=Cymbomonas tetramitiformis TaxID=36881 RepID=A0AAE0FYP1_9CHLO|nr:hypothetical protein CYMTET_23073 [Cymbomonas tetramitiformis]|eukprot:gene34080-biopygen10583
MEALHLLQDVLEFLGIMVAWDKCQGPAQDIVLLGFRMCTNQFGEGPAQDIVLLGVRMCTNQFDSHFVAECLAVYNGQQVVLMKRKVKPSHFPVDASTGTGMGVFLNGRYFAVSWPKLLAMLQLDFFSFRDGDSSRSNYLALISVYWALSLRGGLLRGLTVVLITETTPTKDMLEN